MNKQERQVALGLEIGSTLKKWQEIAEELEMNYVASVLTEEEGVEGFRFQQSARATNKALNNNAVAVFSRLSMEMRTQTLVRLVENAYEVDEEVEEQYKNPINTTK
jgi:hypothetical protein